MSNASIGCTLVVVALSLELAACAAGQAGPWQKPGADAAMVEKDAAECRAAAEQEANRRYPYGFNSPSFGPAGVAMAQQREDTHRSTVEAASFDACMQKRGYQRGSTAN